MSALTPEVLRHLHRLEREASKEWHASGDGRIENLPLRSSNSTESPQYERVDAELICEMRKYAAELIELAQQFVFVREYAKSLE
jgi:hypothetical protein